MNHSAYLSPTPSGMLFDFPAAMRCIIAGQRISKFEWKSVDHYCELREGLLMIHNPDGWHTWIVSEADLQGADWILYEPVIG